MLAGSGEQIRDVKLGRLIGTVCPLTGQQSRAQREPLGERNAGGAHAGIGRSPSHGLRVYRGAAGVANSGATIDDGPDMKILMFQARRFFFAPYLKTSSQAADVTSSMEVNDAAVVFLHAEPEDEQRRSRVLTTSVKNIKWLANKRGLRNVALHSFAHLGTEKASPAFANELIDEAARRLRSTGYEVWVTPLGYSCEWELAVYGDTLAKVFKSF
jgi:hypothetical protein